MWCILVALRVIYFPAVIYGDPVYFHFGFHTTYLCSVSIHSIHASPYIPFNP